MVCNTGRERKEGQYLLRTPSPLPLDTQYQIHKFWAQYLSTRHNAFNEVKLTTHILHKHLQNFNDLPTRLRSLELLTNTNIPKISVLN